LWLHVLAAVFWVGGQLFLILIVMPVLGQQLAESERVRVASLVGRRFAALSGAALGLLLITGPLNAAEHGVSWSILRDTTWGRVLIAKVCMVVVMLALTGVHGAYFGRRLEELGRAATSDPTAAERRRALQQQSYRVSMVNLLLNVGILGLAAWLATLP
jgi:uncharacterized membrane protein